MYIIYAYFFSFFALSTLLYLGQIFIPMCTQHMQIFLKVPAGADT